MVHSAFWVMAHLVGDATLGYHVLNVALHAASAVLVFAILQRLSVPGAICTAVLFAFHPVHTESVAWITELKNTLSGFFCLSALLCYLRFDDTRRTRPYVLALVFFVLALLTKSVTATLPAVILALAWLQRGRVDLQRDVQPLLPFFVFGAVMGIVTSLVERTFVGATGAEFELSFIERCLVAGRAVSFYFWKLMWPLHLVFFYPRWNPDDTQWWQYLFPVAVLLVLALLWRIRAWSRAPFAALLMYGMVLGPALGFVNVFPFRYSFVADHFQYLASLPILAFFVGSIFWLLKTRLSPVVISALVILLVGGPLAVLTRAQSREYVDAETLYIKTIEHNPTAWLAYNNLAMLSLAGNPSKEELEKGLAGFRQAMVLAPKEPLVQFNVGTALYRLKRREEALPYLRAAVKGEPRYAEAWGNLGASLQELDRFEESLPPYRRALEVDPSLEWVRYNISAVLLQLGRADEAAAEIANLPTVGGGMQHRLALAEIFLTQGQFARAIDQYQRAQEAGPLSAEALNQLGYALVQERRAAEAEPYLRRAISLQGNNAAAYSNLGNALQQTGRLEESLAAYRSALAVPDGAFRPETHNDFGVALARAGRFDEAIFHFKEAVRLDPSYTAAQQNLMKAMRSRS